MLNKHLIDFSTHIGLLLKNVRNSLCDIQMQEVFFYFIFFSLNGKHTLVRRRSVEFRSA